MPSHLLHDIFARESVSTHIPGGVADDVLGRFANALTLGAQGPDLFFHNRRRKPTGVFVGARMHRHGYGRAVAAMVERAGAEPGWDWAFILGFAGHAVLDRHLHPFINYFSGRHRPGEDGTMALRYMHPFFERVLDVLFCRKKRGVEPESVDFASDVELPAGPRTAVLGLLTEAVRDAYDLDDESLSARVDNAYEDSMGYYRHSNMITLDDLAESLDRPAENGDIRHWIALVHPPLLPGTVDFGNEARRSWCLPCDPSALRTESVWELYDAAISAMGPILDTVLAGLTRRPADGRQSIADAVGMSDLSSTREARCVRVHSDPLPLNEVVDGIIEAARKRNTSLSR